MRISEEYWNDYALPAFRQSSPILRRKAGLEFPIGRIGTKLRKGRYANRIGAGAPVFLAAVLEYLTSELVDLAGIAAKDRKKSRITPEDIKLVVSKDEELKQVFSGVIIAHGGVACKAYSRKIPSMFRKPSIRSLYARRTIQG